MKAIAGFGLAGSLLPGSWNLVLGAIASDQYLGHLGPRELDRGQLAALAQRAHLRPGQEDVFVATVRAGLRRRHRAADAAEERMLEEHRLDPELVGLEVAEDQLRVVRAVVVADAGVVATDDEVRAAVVLAADRVPDGLARPRVAHRRRERSPVPRTPEAESL